MPLGKDIFDTEGRMCHGHAAEAGTSVILYFRPDLVDMSKATKVNPNVVKFPDIQTFVPMQDKTPSATVGDATVGTAEKGKAVVEKAVARICEFLKEEWAVEIK